MDNLPTHHFHVLISTLKFDIHVEKVIDIVRKIPSQSVCDQVVLFLIKKQMNFVSDKELHISVEVPDNYCMMLKAVLISLSPSLAFNSLAFAYMTILNDEEVKQSNSEYTNIEPILELVVLNGFQLGDFYDGCLLVESLFKYMDTQTHHVKTSLFSRLVLECILCMVPVIALDNERLLQPLDAKIRCLKEPEDIDVCKATTLFSWKLLKLRKMILSWYLNSQTKSNNRHENIIAQYKDNGDRIDLAEEPDFSSVLDGETIIQEKSGPDETVMCLLFLYGPESKQMIRLIQVGHNISSFEFSSEKKLRLLACMKYGCYVDRDIFRIIIDSAAVGYISANNAIFLLEQILNRCKDNDNARIMVDECDVIWDLYNLTKYTPTSKPNTPE